MERARAIRLIAALTLTFVSPGCGLIRSTSKLARMYGEVARGGERGDPLAVPGFDVAAPAARPRFSAGAATEDITPPPGFPTGGHGPAGDVARGHWMRLRARAFFFEDRSGRALALVSADLFAVPAGLHARVARLVAGKLAERKLAVALPPEALVIAATHTHHGPGNFLTARIYNQFGASYPGFSSELFEFLSDRIARAVTAAVVEARSRPEPVELAVRVHRVGYEVVRNRAPWTFTLNQDRDGLLAQLNAGDAPPVCQPGKEEPRDLWELPGCPRLRAVDRAFTVLELVRVEATRRTTAGALVFFAAHPTVLPASTPFYGSDFAGHAMLSLEASLASGAPAVVAFFNGAEGDVTARRARRDLRDTVALGDAFGRAVAASLRASPDRVLRDPDVAVRTGGWHPGRAEEGRCGRGEGEARLASAPKVGAAALGGAEDDRTPFHALGWRDGVRDKAFDGQGVKLPALDSRIVRGMRFSDDFAPPDAFPDELPLTLATIGDLVLAAVPLELTTAQGQAIRRRLGMPHGQLEIVGLANEYASYCTTHDEYSAQDYSGASTLWGPDEGAFLACRLDELIQAPPQAATRRARERVFWPGTSPHDRFGRGFTSTLARPDEGLEYVLRDRGGLPERRLPWFAWEESLAAPEFEQSGARRVSIRAARDDGSWRDLEDDAGAGFLTVYLGGVRWGAIWLSPLLRDDVRGTFSFAVSAGGERRCSQPFQLTPGRPGPDRVHAAGSCEDGARAGRK
jgi:neutral ceramidase